MVNDDEKRLPWVMSSSIIFKDDDVYVTFTDLFVVREPFKDIFYLCPLDVTYDLKKNNSFAKKMVFFTKEEIESLLSVEAGEHGFSFIAISDGTVIHELKSYYYNLTRKHDRPVGDVEWGVDVENWDNWSVGSRKDDVSKEVE